MNFHTFIKTGLIRILILIVSLFFLTSCLQEYREHFDAKHSTVGAYTGEYRTYYSGDILGILPNKDIKYSLIEQINLAQNRVWLEIYMITDRDIVASMIRAHNRGVDVRVILEGNVYGLPFANTSIFKELQKSGIPVKYADGYQFTFTHAKFCIIDNTYHISSGNFTKSYFESNRDFIFSATDIQTLEFLVYLFLQDFSYKTVNPSYIPPYIILSPDNSRIKIEQLLSRAQESILLYTQTLQDGAILDILQKKKQAGLIIQVCTADNSSNTEASAHALLDWVLMKNPYLHGKIILLDHQVVFLGSQNLTTNSLENNREVGIILAHNPVLVGKILKSFYSDCIFP